MNGRKDDTGEKSDRAKGRRYTHSRIVELGELGFGHFMLEVNAMSGQEGGGHFPVN